MTIGIGVKDNWKLVVGIMDQRNLCDSLQYDTDK
jgi:hypothetical protein